MPVLRNIGRLARCSAAGAASDLHVVSDAALAWENGRLLWAGPERDLPDGLRGMAMEDAGGALVIPGLVDCHTHLAFGGWRADEFEMRLLGRSYREIASRGGGILSTRRQTRALDHGALQFRCRRFLNEMLQLGVTTVEAKSGYGLDEASELGLLEVYRTLGEDGPQRLVPTLLAAHAIPPEFQADRDGYVDLVCRRIIPEAARRGLARFCDVFVEDGAFMVDEARRILRTGLEHGFRPKLHADQLGSGGGAELAGELGAASADHLEYVSEDGIAALARAGVVAVSLPIATLYLGQRPMPARRLLDAGIRVAVATDFNPGSAPSYHLPLAMTLACTLQRMTPAEALRGATITAAEAIGVDAECGSLDAGKSADFVLIDAPDVNHWLYHFRPNACLRTVIAGHTVWSA